MPVSLKNNIFWVGYVDWSVRDFHSYDTVRGATYNSYLIRDEKTAVIDGVNENFVDFQLHRIAALTTLDKVDYVVCNHTELDHAGSIPELLKALPNATLLCNAKCYEEMKLYFDTTGWRVKVVSPDETVSLGKRTLAFVNTPMVHWPESMVTYVPEDELLFSMDAFGQHIATSERFDDEYDLGTILTEAKLYYANIVTPYGKQVQTTLDKAKGLKISMIAPAHGLIWRKNISAILEHYQRWSLGEYSPKALILFDSMWHSTEKMAEGILQGAADSTPDVDTQLMNVRRTTLTRIATEMLDASAVAIGSPTLNMMLMPQMAAVLTYIKGLKFTQKTAFAFGSYGWASAGCDQCDKWLDELNWTRLCDPIKIKFRPDQAALQQCREAGKKLAEAAKARVAK
ncbi:MAG: FprA family A-type flavoprotein [Planctomycetaceae bacterium]|jgi:flavorubredoxin|nr:FprA family A-type flavoprotein [Planctomycetaceae bacterium]